MTTKRKFISSRSACILLMLLGGLAAQLNAEPELHMLKHKDFSKQAESSPLSATIHSWVGNTPSYVTYPVAWLAVCAAVFYRSRPRDRQRPKQLSMG